MSPSTRNPARIVSLPELLEYADLGLPFVPLQPRAKIPCLTDWPRRASVDHETIADWVGRWPGCNVGLRTGHGWIVVDVDKRRGGYAGFRKLLPSRHRPATAVARTGGGGQHWIFRVPCPVRYRADLAPGVDLLGEDGLMVAPPSLHPTGRPYRWLSHPRDGIADCPARLMDAFRAAGLLELLPEPLDLPLGPCDRDGDETALFVDLIRRYPVPGRGCRNTLMVKGLTSLLQRRYHPELAAEVVRQWWSYFYHLGRIGTPPDQAPREIARSVRSILKSSTFLPSRTSEEHLQASVTDDLRPEQEWLLDAPIEAWRASSASDSTRALVQEGGDRRDVEILLTPHRERVHRAMDTSLCRTEADRAFVEAISLHAAHQLACGRVDTILMTDRQVAEIAQLRREIRLGPQQIENLKRRYFTREERPATHLELLVQVVRGYRPPGKGEGKPSEYRLSGLNAILFPDRSRRER